MSQEPRAWKSHAARVVALVLMFATYGLTRLPDLSPESRATLAQRFNFSAIELPTWEGRPFQTRRPVNPSLELHAGWISAVGAAVALGDLDGDGYANDVCLVDPRSDEVTLAPVPGTQERYPLFRLDVTTLPYARATMAPMGCVPADVNEDGFQDILVYYWGRTPVIFVQEETGEFNRNRFREVELTQSGDRWFTNAVTFADLDGDGHQDLIVGNYFQDNAHILDAQTTVVDEMQDSMSRAFNGGVNRVFRGVPGEGLLDFTFIEVPGLFAEEEVHSWPLAVGAADLNGDLLPELYYANDFGPDRLYYNQSSVGEMRFSLVEGKRKMLTPRSKVLGQDSFKGMSVDFADVNADGRLDFFVSNIAHDYALHESHFLFVHDGSEDSMADGIAPYNDLGESYGVSRSSWGWDTRFGDFDNDGVPEALQATGFLKGETDRWAELQELATGNDELLKKAGVWPRFKAGDDLSGHYSNPFYVRAKDGRYYDIAAEVGLDVQQVGRGVATADVDADGDLDFVFANQWEPSFFYRNGSASQNQFLGLSLRHPVESRSEVLSHAGVPTKEHPSSPAVGAAARFVRPDGLIMVGQVDGGNGHSGVRAPDLHFGLGQIDVNETLDVEIRYRDRDGEIGVVKMALKPGWHTVLLPDVPTRSAGRTL